MSGTPERWVRPARGIGIGAAYPTLKRLSSRGVRAFLRLPPILPLSYQAQSAFALVMHPGPHVAVGAVKPSGVKISAAYLA
jgi:hypothetical protein